MKKRFALLEENSSSTKKDNSSNQDISDIQDSSNKQVRSRKQNSSNKQDKPSKQDISSNNIIDMNPNVLCDKLRDILSKPDMTESDYTMSKMLLDELLRTKSITRKDYNGMCKQIGISIK